MTQNGANVISCPSLVGPGMTEAMMKSLVTRGHGPELLANMCRGVHGCTTGTALGCLLTMDVNSGKVQGARYVPIAEEGTNLIELNAPARKIWPKAGKKMEVAIQIRPGDIHFRGDAGEMKGARCVSEWVDAKDNDGFVVSDKGAGGSEIVDKSTWDQHEGLKEGACWRLMLEPESPEQVKMKLLMVPVSKEALISMTTENAVDMDDPALPAISMANSMKMRFFPREETYVSGLGFLPLLYFNTNAEELVLPGMADVKREFFNLLRDVVKPNVVKADKWLAEFGETHWKKPKEPTMIWPAPPAGNPSNPGELSLVYGRRDVCSV